MDKFIYLYITLLILMKVAVSYFRYFKAVKSGSVLLKGWANPLSVVDIALLCTITYVVIDIITNRLGRNYLISLYFVVYIVVQIALESILIVTDNGIYFKTDYTKWSAVDEIELIDSSKVRVHRRKFLTTQYVIRNLKRQEKFMATIKDKCSVK